VFKEQKACQEKWKHSQCPNW